MPDDIHFSDPGFKVYLTLTMWADDRFKKKLRAAVKKAGVDRWDPTLHPEVAQFLADYPIPADWLSQQTSLGYPEFKAISTAVPGWDGEAAPYKVTDWTGLLLLPNLEEFEWPDSGHIPPDAIPEHPKLRKLTLPTSGWKKSNKAAFKTLEARGFVVVSSQKHGLTVLEKP